MDHAEAVEPVDAVVPAEDRLSSLFRIHGHVLKLGLPLDVDVALENIGTTSIALSDTRVLIQVQTPSGEVLREFSRPTESRSWDLSPLPNRGGPQVPPRTLAPGERWNVSSPTDPTVVRWIGSLDVVVRCVADEQIELPPMRAVVRRPSRTPSREEAVEEALNARPGLLEQCRPKPDGSWTQGILTPPDGIFYNENGPLSERDLSPITARCSVQFIAHDGFAEVSIRVVAPADAPAIEFTSKKLDEIAYPGGGLPDEPIGLLRWTIIVTDEEVYDSNVTQDAGRTRAARVNTITADLFWENGRWKIGGGTACGALGNSFMWLSRCPH